MFRTTDTNIVVGFFTGTGVDYANDKTTSSAHISSINSTHYSNDPNQLDQSFLDLTLSLDLTESKLGDDDQSKQDVYGYDGCDRRGGGIFAYGIEEPCINLFNHILTKANNNLDSGKLTVVLTAHSRGCLSALLLAKEINANDYLKNNVDVILDLRDPVPGNLNSMTGIDIAKTTIAKQLFDLEDCSCIKEAHITIQEKGFSPNFFDVLVPKFHADTKLSVEYLPGYHDIQETFDKNITRDYQNVLIRHPFIYLLGFLKSLQILSEKGVPIDHSFVKDGLLTYLNKMDQGKTTRDKIDDETADKTASISTRSLVSNSSFEAKNFTLTLKELQIHIYERLLKKFNTPNTASKQERDLHFGGTFSVTAPDPRKANCLNMRHATLIREVNPPKEEDYYPRPLLGFKQSSSQRIDITNARMITIPDNLFQQNYQRIMLVLDQEIQSNLLIPNTNPPKKYIDVIKSALSTIANNNSLSITQKTLTVERYLLESYRLVRSNEGWFTSRLRTGLERIMNSDHLLGMKYRYGIHFPENDNQSYAKLYERSEKLSKIIGQYEKAAENHPDLYHYAIKFLIKLNEEFEPNNQIEQIYNSIMKLLSSGNNPPLKAQENKKKNTSILDTDSDDESSSNKNTKNSPFNEFKLQLSKIYTEIRQKEGNHDCSCFHKGSKLGNFIENFLKNECGISLPRSHAPSYHSGFDTTVPTDLDNDQDNRSYVFS